MSGGRKNIFHFKALKNILFVPNQVNQYFSCNVLSSINLACKLNFSRGKYCLFHLEIVKTH